MNNTIFLTFFISLVIHGVLFVIPQNLIPSEFFKSDIVKGRSSIEIVLVQNVPTIEVKPGKKAEMKLPKAPSSETVKKPDVLRKEEKTPFKKSDGQTRKPSKAPKPAEKTTIGAITREISTLLLNQPPIYPKLARMRGWEGHVILIAEVDKNGRVINVEMFSSSGHSVLDEASLRAVRRWRFRNVNMLTQVKIPIKFMLTDE